MRFYVLAAVIAALSLSPSAAALGKPRYASRSSQGRVLRPASYSPDSAVMQEPQCASCGEAPAVEYGVADTCDVGCPCPTSRCCRPLIPMVLDGIGCVVQRLLICVDNCVCGCGCRQYRCGAYSDGCVDSCCGDAADGYPMEAVPGEFEGGVQLEGTWEGEVAPAPGAGVLDAPPAAPKDARRGPALPGPHTRSYGVSHLRPIPASPKTASKQPSRRASGSGNVSWVRYVEDAKEGQTAQKPAPRSASGQLEFRVPHNPLR